MANIKWGYAVTQNVRRRDVQETAFKQMSVCGFRGVELRASTGRGAVLGRPDLIEINFGTVHDLMDFLRSCGIDQVASFFYDPGIRFEEEDYPSRSPSNPKDHEGIAGSIKPFAAFLHDVGGSCLVVRPMGSYWSEAPVTEEKIKNAAECWNKVGKMTKDYGVQTAMHVDCLCALHSTADIDRILALTNPDLVGLAIDTGELTVAGIDPVKLYERHYGRVQHFHFKDARFVDTLEEYKLKNAESQMLTAGGQRKIERWFYEMGRPGGLVNFQDLMKSINGYGYKGWIIVESEQCPNPPESCMLNSWYVQHVLSKI
jgi:inosose dehydratase